MQLRVLKIGRPLGSSRLPKNGKGVDQMEVISVGENKYVRYKSLDETMLRGY